MKSGTHGCAGRNRGKTTGKHVVTTFLLVVSLTTVPCHAWREYDRWVHLQGADNFRDIGAYDAGTTAMVAPGLVFRSGDLYNSDLNATTLTVNDAAIIRSLGIRLIIDLRTTTNVALYPDSALLDDFTTHVYLPLNPSGTELEWYRAMARDHGDTWRQVFEILADPDNLPLNCHCWAGKDRTGALIALLLTFLGVERRFVEYDYLLSREVYGWKSVHPTWLQAFLEEVDSAGGIDAYLDNAGVTAPVREAVRRNLLVERPAAVRPSWTCYR